MTYVWFFPSSSNDSNSSTKEKKRPNPSSLPTGENVIINSTH